MTLTLEDARHEAAINAKAARLFTPEGGYRLEPFETSATDFFVFPPDPDKPAYIVDTAARTCTCAGFEEYGLCSHLLGTEMEIADAERYDEEAAMREEWETFGKYLQASYH